MPITDCGYCVLLANCDAQLTNAWDFYTFAAKMLCEIADNTGGLGPSEDVNIAEVGGVAVTIGDFQDINLQRIAGETVGTDFYNDTIQAIQVLPVSPGDPVRGTTGDIVDTTSTEVIPAGAGSLRTYVTAITVSNLSEDVATRVDILDGASVMWQGPAAFGGGGFTIAEFDPPLVGTAATAVNAQCGTTGAIVQVSVSGYQAL